ncbi:MAG TPA: RcnB family protein [Terracidiphilus sp.]|jgi:Ni/Co efflux regulator RcnB
MRPLLKTLAVSALALSFTGVPVIAQDHHDDQEHRDSDHRNNDHRDNDHRDKYVHHDEWRKGEHMRHEDWDRGRRVDDWQAHHLRHPPSGYEWRDVDGQYVLANGAGVIFQIVVPR